MTDIEEMERKLRLRQHLNYFRSSFLSLKYIDGSGISRYNAYNIWINLCLLIARVQPCFMVRSTDYADGKIYNKIMQLLSNFRDTMSLADLDYRLHFDVSDIGVCVYTNYSYHKEDLSDLVVDGKGNFVIYVSTFGIDPVVLLERSYCCSEDKCMMLFEKIKEAVKGFDIDCCVSWEIV